MRRATLPASFVVLGLSLAACADDTPSTDDEIGTTSTPPDMGAADTDPTQTGTETATDTDTDTGETGVEDCVADPPPEAMLRMGPNQTEDGEVILAAGGHRIAYAGPHALLPGFPADVVVHPFADVAYVTSTPRKDRRLLVVDLEFNEVIQDIDRDNAFYGLELSADGSRLYSSSGGDDIVEVYDVGMDGLLTKAADLPCSDYPSGLALSPDGNTLWAGQWRGEGSGTNKTSTLFEFDTQSLSEVRQIELPLWAWDVVHLPSRQELYVSAIDDEGIAVVDLVTGTVAEVLDLTLSPAGLAVGEDDERVYAAVAGTDLVVAIDAETRAVTAEAAVGELLDEEGDPYRFSNVNAVTYDAVSDRLYATRGADNAVSVLDGSSLEVLGAFPAGWWPTDVALTSTLDRLVVVDGKGGWYGPNAGEGIKDQMTGSISVVDLEDGFDLDGLTDQAQANFRRPGEVFPFTCELDNFPIPSKPGDVSPIEHVILIVKENKTFDCIFADSDIPDIDTDASELRWGYDYTPNTHELGKAFALSDNFYSEAEVSDTGHLWLTGGHLSEYAQRTWIESYSGEDFQGYQLLEAAGPGDYFVHLIDEGVDFTVYGEVVGTLSASKEGNGAVFEHIDGGFPGGPYLNYSVKDEDKAQYVADKISGGTLKPFTYLLLPNDHTNGTSPGTPSPESMIADNDVAVGIVVDAVSKSEFWDKTAVIILQDDPQGCGDHVDAHRSYVVVASPWARRGHVSHVHAGFASVFATIDRILGVPPVGRRDAVAAPLWDFFTAVPDFAPYDHVPRIIPETNNDGTEPGWEASMAMDFSGPDRNPELGVVLEAYWQWRQGNMSKAEAEAMIADPKGYLGAQEWAELVEEAEEETEAFEEAKEAYEAYLGAKAKAAR
ncbi:hypothetical protein PPSIR1_42336 [Plesiocystis pacifica SIR-1]|uniref:Lipoprotein n=1 Tax=Plesiocystis pacifica SIR-1 TaxID=391625 RepID=A6GD23_9BACT|nr:bifunctional YncE family protein/alkaline phosphatase family protein [Plesiocystis pacifica]EDM76261.1 hypothetical protein PPSIR1_42336 [Plesiocystis pacifica SIR-1]